MAETVISPRGGTAAFLDTNRRACLKLQNESGYSGEISNIFMMKNFRQKYTSEMRNRKNRDK